MALRTDDDRSSAFWRRRITYGILAVVGIILIYAILYKWAVGALIGEHISYIHALHVVIEALTTAGFGGDSDIWRQSDILLAIVILMNISGVLLVFLAIPLFASPLLREMLDTQPPTSSSLTDHVIICGFFAQDVVLSRELDQAAIPYLYIDPDETLITRLSQQGINAIVGEPDDNAVLQAANVDKASAFIADIDDETNPAAILSAKRINPDIRSISVIRDPESEPYHRLAKADEIILSRQLLGEGLAHRAARTFAEKLRRQIKVKQDVEITELRIEPHSKLVGKTLQEATSLSELGITVIGGWIGEKFVISPEPDTVIEHNTILLIAGSYQIPENVQVTQIPPRGEVESRVIVCGYGTVGRAVTETLCSEGINVEVIDLVEKEGVDIIGDISNIETFKKVNLQNTQSVVLSIDEDIKSIYATLIINHLAPDVEIIVRADDTKSIQEMYNAGADFVLSLPDMTGEILASRLIDDTQIVTPAADFKFIRVDGAPFAGRSLKDLDIRRETGCWVVAVERNDELLMNIGGGFTIRAEDVLITAGVTTAHERLSEWKTLIDLNNTIS